MSSESFSNELQKMVNVCFNHTNDIIFFINEESSIIFSNKKAIDSLGYSEEELGKKKIYEIASSKHRSRLEKLSKNIPKKGQLRQELELSSRDGSTIYTENVIMSVYDTDDSHLYFVCKFRDISKQISIKQSLEDERNLTETILSTIDALIVVLDPKGRIVRFNRFCELLTGYDFEEVLGKKMVDIFLIQEEKNSVQKYIEQIKLGNFPSSHTNYWLTKKGEKKLISWSNNCITDETGKVTHIIGTGIDTTEKDNTEKDLNLKADLLNSVNDSVMVLNLKGDFIYVNETAHRERGYTREEMLPMNIGDFIEGEYRDLFQSRLQAIVEGKEATFETQHLCKDGSILEIEFRSKLIEIDKEKFILSVGRDISERKKVTKELVSSENRFRELFNNISSGVAIYQAVDDGEDFIFVDINKAGEQIDQINKEEIIGEKLTKVFPSVKEFGLLEVFQKVWRTGESIDHPISFYKDSRLEGWRENFVYMLSTGEIVSVYNDVTENKHAEIELKIKDLAIKTSINAIAITDLEGKLTYINTAFLEMWGFSDKTEVLGRQILEFWHDPTDDADKIIRILQIQGNWIGELVAKKKDETFFDIQLSANMVFDDEGVPINMMSSFINITERKKAEDELIIMNHALETSPMGLSISNPSGVVIYVNPAFMKMWGYNEKEVLIGKHVSELYQMTGHNQNEQEFLESRKQMEKKGFWKGEFESKALDGTLKWVTMTASVILDTAGNKKGNLTFFEEITEKKKAEKALEEREEILQSVIDNSQFGYSLEEKEGKIIRINPALVKMLGYSHEELLNLELDDITPEEYRAKTREITQQIINREISVGEIEKEYIRKDGTLIPVRLSIWEIYDTDDKPAYFVGLIEDITDRKKNEIEKEETYRKINELNEQLTVINTILRHDIRNNLVITNGSIDAFLDSNKESFLHMAKKTTTKSENLIDKMQEVEEIITKGERDLVKIDVRNIAEEVISTYANIGIHFDLKGKGSAQADAALGSVIDNIIGNALKHSEMDTISITIKSSKDSCVIEIADNGKGIPDDFKKKLFEHGFRFGSMAGTGLGLYIVKKTIDQYGGSIKVKNNLPKGTIFEIELKNT